MNINYFLSLVLLGLVMIYILFEPMDIQKQNYKEIPLFSLNKFTLHEIDKTGLTTVMIGSQGKRFSNRYDIQEITYIDGSKELSTHMKAKHGLYKNEVLHLDGDVFFTREDGLKFFSQNVTYNKKTDILNSDVDYVALMNNNQVYGTNAKVNNKSNTITSKNVFAVYEIKEEQ